MKNSVLKHPSERLDASYLPGCEGSLFCLVASGEPADGDLESVKHFVLFVPPFGEEVNLCRRFQSLVRANLSRAGVVCVIPDLYGTGDSEGLLEDADWDSWRQDLVKVVQHFCVAGGSKDNLEHRLSIVAIRAGCLLAADLVQSMKNEPDIPELENIVFFQPERNGKEVISRLFRSRILAQRLAGDRSENTQDLWSLLKAGQCIRAGGHLLSAELCMSMSEKTLDDFLLVSHGKVRTWFELQKSGSTSVQRAEEFSLVGWNVSGFKSAPFWQMYEVEPDESTVLAVVCAILQ